MKIKSVAISNMLSFGLQDRALAVPTITFETTSENHSPSILIGPNGSGKSNFIEILTRALRHTIPSAGYTESYLAIDEVDLPQPQDVLKGSIKSTNRGNRLSIAPHFATRSEPQSLILALELGNQDLENVRFLHDHRDGLNQILAAYSTLSVVIPQFVEAEQWPRDGIVRVLIDSPDANQNGKFKVIGSDETPLILIEFYLTHFEVLQHCITIRNRFKKLANEEDWKLLHPPFALMGSYRNYAGIGRGISVDANRSFNESHARLRSESTRAGDSGEPGVFDLVRRRLAFRFFDLLEQGGYKFAFDKLQMEEPLLSLNRILATHVGLRLTIRKPRNYDTAVEIRFLRDDECEIQTENLSAGEKSLIHFVFVLFGMDLENSLVVIDEPELHLHPQLQKRYLSIIRAAAKQWHLQFIIATHSPMFVTPETIAGTFRFRKIDDITHVVSPSVNLEYRMLTRILNLSNTAKIFFVSRVILVEGETDEYFFRILLDLISSGSAPGFDVSAVDYEILNIEGKGAREAWTKFLKAFGIEVSFIGDWDNVRELCGVDVSKYEKQYAAAVLESVKAVEKKGSSDGSALFQLISIFGNSPTAENLTSLAGLCHHIVRRHVDYKDVVNHIRESDPAGWSSIVECIEEAEGRQVFILKQGEIEDYLGLREKGLRRLIDFCQNEFAAWLISEEHSSHRAEFEGIFKSIFAMPK